MTQDSLSSVGYSIYISCIVFYKKSGCRLKSDVATCMQHERGPLYEVKAQSMHMDANMKL